MSDLLAEFLATLSDEQKVKLGESLIGSVTPAKKAVKKVVKKKVVKRVAKKKVEEPKPLDDAPIRTRGVKKKRTKKKYDIRDNLPESKGSPAAKSNIQIGPRPNAFVDSPKFLGEADYTRVQKESKGDKKLYVSEKGTKIAPTKRERVGKVESTCKKCGYKEDISIKLLTYDEESKGKKQHICDDCVRSSE